MNKIKYVDAWVNIKRKGKRKASSAFPKLKVEDWFFDLPEEAQRGIIFEQCSKYYRDTFVSLFQFEIVEGYEIDGIIHTKLRGVIN